MIALAKMRRNRRDDVRNVSLVWRRGSLEAAGSADLVFLDPDNGIEVSSRPVGRKQSSKYVAWAEIEELWGCGCSILVYQHFTRESRRQFAERLSGKLANRLNPAVVKCLRTPDVLYLFALQSSHVGIVQQALELVEKQWEGQLDSVGLPNGSLHLPGFAGR